MGKKQWANLPFHPGTWPFFYGWMILLWGVVGMLMSIPGQTIGVSAFTESLLEVLDTSRDELSLAYMFGTIGSSLLLPWTGKRYDQYGARPLAVCAAIGLGLVLLIFSRIDLVLFNLLKIDSDLVIVFCMTLGFMALRFFGQGVLTISSKNMMMEWFDSRRGLATGLANVFFALAFSASPLFLSNLIGQYGWSSTWQILACITGLIFPIVAIIFFRNRPEDSGLLPDGNFTLPEKKKKLLFAVVKQYTRREAVFNYAFWVFALMMAMQGLYITGFTFHVVSIFEEAGYSSQDAFGIFQPAAVVAVITTLTASSVSDYIELKFLLYVKGTAACLGVLGVALLGIWDLATYMIIGGNGIMGGLFAVLTSITWPRYYGRAHLGAITGLTSMMIVFGSALGPIIFSTSLSLFGDYSSAGWACLAIYAGFSIGAIWADNPQKILAKKLRNPLEGKKA